MLFRLALLALLLALAPPSSLRADESAAPDSLPAWQRYAWVDLSPIMSKAEEQELRALADPEALAEWRQRFWLRRDPTPTTERNERREIHFKRLETARSRYPASTPLGLDLRGRDYVLFGPPDETVEVEDWFDERGHHPGRETWIWLAPEMRATYSDWNLDGEWEQAFDEYPSSRVDVRRRLESAFLQDGSVDDTHILDEIRLRDPAQYESLIRQLSEGELVNPLEVQSQALIAELMGPRFRRMEGAYFQHRRERKDTYAHDFGAPPLENVYFAVDCFRGERGRTRVELSHQLRIRDLRFEWDFDEQTFRGELLRRVVFFDEEGRRASISEERLPLRAESIEDTQSALLVPGLDVHLLSPGVYRMALRLEDLRSGRLQIFENSRVEVPAFAEDELSLSDITFATLLEEGTEPALFRKGAWVVHPHPLRSYSTEREIQLYFEVYGLGTDAQGLNDYTVTYRIRPRHPRVKSGWLWTRERVVDAELSSTFADRHGGESARHPLSILAAEFAEDSYILEVEVRDRLRDRSAKGRTQFSVVLPSLLR